MKGKRAKQYRKLMHQYELTFNFREPYQVLVDAAILQDAFRMKYDVVAGLERTLQGKIKPMITQCSMRHLYTSKPSNPALIDQARTCERRRCNHHTLEQPLTALECLLSVVDPKNSNTNKHRYAVATQDPEVRKRLREIPGVPLVYINRSVMILEPMAGATEEVREREEKGKFRIGLRGKVRGFSEGTLKRKREDGEDNGKDRDEKNMEDDGEQKQDGEETLVKKKTKKGPKGPNPLSIKKSKKPPPETGVKPAKRPTGELELAKPAAALQNEGEEESVAKTKRKRRHKRKGEETARGSEVAIEM